VQFVNSVDCGKLLPGAYTNHAIFTKPIYKGSASGCWWYRLHTIAPSAMIIIVMETRDLVPFLRV